MQFNITAGIQSVIFSRKNKSGYAWLLAKNRTQRVIKIIPLLNVHFCFSAGKHGLAMNLSVKNAGFAHLVEIFRNRPITILFEYNWLKGKPISQELNE